MKIQIYNVIGLNKLQYINYVDGEFNVWCENVSNKFYVPMRELQKSTSLYKWFLKKWETNVVSIFLLENQSLIMDNVKDTDVFRSLFLDIVNDQKSKRIYYPSPIVKKIQQQHYKYLDKE